MILLFSVVARISSFSFLHWTYRVTERAMCWIQESKEQATQGQKGAKWVIK
jgi:hypothetical protein